MADYKWIGLIRKFHNCSFYNDSNAVQMFLHIFLNAQREDKPYFDQIIMRGQFRTSIKDIMTFLEISRKSARRSLDKLKAAGIIHITSLRRNGVLITVREFSKFLALGNMPGGWVKLYYDLDYQDFFVNAQVLHIYLHLLLHTYSRNENYDDPLWFDMKKISSATGISIEGIKESLHKLRKAGILNLGYDGQKKLSSVQLIEFSEYIKDSRPAVSVGHKRDTQGSSDLATFFPVEEAIIVPEEEGIKATQKEAKEGPKKSQVNFARNAYESSANNSVIIDKTDDYRSMGQKEGQKTAQKSPKENVSKSLPKGHEGGYAREPITKENRDKRLGRGYYHNNSTSQKFSSIEELVADEDWVKSMQRFYGFPSKETLYTALTLFLENLKCRKEEVPETLAAFLDYFCNWYKRNERKLQGKLKAQTPTKDLSEVLWGKCMSAFEKIVDDNILVSVFKRISFESFDKASQTLLLSLPSQKIYETLETDHLQTMTVVLRKFFGTGVRLNYRIIQPKRISP